MSKEKEGTAEPKVNGPTWPPFVSHTVIQRKEKEPQPIKINLDELSKLAEENKKIQTLVKEYKDEKILAAQYKQENGKLANDKPFILFVNHPSEGIEIYTHVPKAVLAPYFTYLTGADVEYHSSYYNRILAIMDTDGIMPKVVSGVMNEHIKRIVLNILPFIPLNQTLRNTDLKGGLFQVLKPFESDDESGFFNIDKDEAFFLGHTCWDS